MTVGSRGETSLFDPELRRVARVLPRRAVTKRNLPVIRFLLGLQARRRPSDVEVHAVGEVSVRLHRPLGAGAGPLPAVLWIHGGGYVIGTAAQEDTTCRRFARRLGALVAAVDYRLAPEHPFPTPLDDCHDALAWLAARDDVDPSRVAIGGASAGGGLAAGLALLARDRGEVRPVAQVLAYPMLDDRTVLRAGVDERNLRLWDNRANRFGWSSYTGVPPGSPEVSGFAAPARHEDLTGLPPAWIGVGTLDLFHDEDVTYAERLRDAGVDCDLDVVDGAFHGFDIVRPKVEVSRAFAAAQDATFAAAFARLST
jgi:acetyl esterase/lipase